jgi:hypothetical protein
MLHTLVPNRIIAHDIQIKNVKSEIRDYCVNYNKRLEVKVKISLFQAVEAHRVARG